MKTSQETWGRALAKSDGNGARQGEWGLVQGPGALGWCLMGGGAERPKELGKVWCLAGVHTYLCARQVKQAPSSPVDCSHLDAKAMPMATLAARPSWVPNSRDCKGAGQGCCPSGVCSTQRRTWG